MGVDTLLLKTLTAYHTAVLIENLFIPLKLKSTMRTKVSRTLAMRHCPPKNAYRLQNCSFDRELIHLPVKLVSKTLTIVSSTLSTRHYPGPSPKNA